eukprot:g4240.t1
MPRTFRQGARQPLSALDRTLNGTRGEDDNETVLGHAGSACVRGEDNNEMVLGHRGGALVPLTITRRNEMATCKVECVLAGSGTGSLVKVEGLPCILTNHHVLPSIEASRGAKACFEDFPRGVVEVALAPGKLFATYAKLDFTVVALEEQPCRSYDAKPFEHLEIKSHPVQAGDTLSIVQHPGRGEKKRSSGSVVKISDCGNFVLYNLDTDYGSSGSPVFMDGHLVALHHQRSPEDKANRGVLLSSIRPRLLQVIKEGKEKAAREKAAREKAAREKAARERAVKEKVAAEEAATEEVERARAAAEQAAAEQAATEKAVKKKVEGARVAAENAAAEMAEKVAIAEQAARELAAAKKTEKAAREKAEKARVAVEKATAERAAAVEAAAEEVEKARAAAEQAAAVMTEKVAAQEQATRERVAAEQAARAQQADSGGGEGKDATGSSGGQAGADPDRAWTELAEVIGSDAAAKLRDGTTTELKLKGKKIGDAGVAVLAKVLPECTALTKLDLYENEVSDAGVATLAQVLPQCRALTELYLVGNHIGASGANALSAVLPQCAALYSLSLSRNHIGDSGVNALCAVLPQCAALKCLYLSGNHIGDSGGNALCAVLPQCAALKTLFLRDNQIGSPVNFKLKEMCDTVRNTNGDTIKIWLNGCFPSLD